MSEERERTRNYNPADYKAVEETAKGMPKQELEDYYVKARDRKYTSCGAGWGIFIGVVAIIFFIGAMGYFIAETKIVQDVSNNIEVISEDICPILGQGYVSSELFKGSSTYYTNKIVCDSVNSIPK